MEKLIKTDWRIVVIGAGPVGVRFCNELLKKQSEAEILLIGEEPYLPYNRIRLTTLLAGESDVQSLNLDLPDKNKHPNFKYFSSRVRQVDRKFSTVSCRDDTSIKYTQLVFATGARAFIPKIEGIDKPGVFRLRDLRDAEKLKARAARARHVVVMGGGLLGLETARAMLDVNTKVTLIQQGERLLNKQLDEEAAQRLQKKVEALGINIVTQVGVRKIRGEESVTAVVTRDKQIIECDTVIVCTGISPNIEIARDANLPVRRGILIDDALRTEDARIFAIGECCEHEGITYGLVSPGFEQASILADVLSGGKSAYKGSLEVSRLKVVGENIISMGEQVVAPYTSSSAREWVYETDSNYRKLVVSKGKVLSAIGVGEWPEARRIQEIFQRDKKLSIWQLLRFRYTGNLLDNESNDISQWDDEAIICQCNSINKLSIETTIKSGSSSVSEIGKQCLAGTVCGSCKPLLQNLLENTLDKPVVVEKEKSWVTMGLTSLTAVLAAILFVFLPAIAVSETVQQKSLLEQFWNDKWWKQATGFSLLGLTVIGLIMSLRKRLKLFQLASFSFWRMAHMLLGASCVFLLIAHTGMSLGANLNQLLMINFLLIVVLGGATGAVLAASHKLSAQASVRLRKALSWTHLIVSWPLPMLLAVHIFTVYYY